MLNLILRACIQQAVHAGSLYVTTTISVDVSLWPFSRVIGRMHVWHCQLELLEYAHGSRRDLNCGLLVSKATAIPSEPTPQPMNSIYTV